MHVDAWQQLEARLARLKIYKQDLIEQFVRSGGAGGQHVNKVSSCVILTHIPSGISVRCEDERSQIMNRFRARERLAARVETIARERIARERSELERAKRQKRGRNKAAKNRMLKNKHHRSLIKQNRRPNYGDD